MVLHGLKLSLAFLCSSLIVTHLALAADQVPPLYQCGSQESAVKSAQSKVADAEKALANANKKLEKRRARERAKEAAEMARMVAYEHENVDPLSNQVRELRERITGLTTPAVCTTELASQIKELNAELEKTINSLRPKSQKLAKMLTVYYEHRNQAQDEIWRLEEDVANRQAALDIARSELGSAQSALEICKTGGSVTPRDESASS